MNTLHSHTLRMMNAVTHLMDGGFHEMAIMLFYAAVDHMAWISSADEKVTRHEFMRWVDEHMLSKNGHGLEGVSSADLYGARCGYLHNSSPDSDMFRNGKAAHQLAYTYGPLKATALQGKILAVRVEDLFASFMHGVIWFEQALKENPTNEAAALAKLDKMTKNWSLN